MEILRGWLGKYSESRDRMYQERKAKEERNRATKRNLAEVLIIEVYINPQGKISQSVKEIQTALAGEPLSDYAKEILRRMQSSVTFPPTTSSNAILQAGEEKIFNALNLAPQERDPIRLKALNNARDFWETKLAQSDISPEDRISGNNKIAQLDARREQIIGPVGPQHLK